MDKPRVLAISKSDMLDDELRDEIARTVPQELPSVFISAVTGQGITELKDLLWRAITDENNRGDGSDAVHRPLDARHRVREEDEFIFQYEPGENEEEEDEDLQSISPDTWGEDIDWDDAEFEYGDNADDSDSRASR